MVICLDGRRLSYIHATRNIFGTKILCAVSSPLISKGEWYSKTNFLKFLFCL